jgi:hypothetical protein
MSNLILLESFDWNSDPQLQRGPFNLAPSSGRTPGRTGWGWGTGATATLPGSDGNGYAEWTCGMATNAILDGISINYIAFKNNLTFGHPTITLAGVGDGTLYIDAFLGGSDTTSSPSTFVMSSETWYYLEMQVQSSLVNVGASGGMPAYYYAEYVYTVMVNGSTTILSGTIDTPHQTGSAPSNGANFRQLTVGGGTVDDVYLTDTEFLGDISVQTPFPNADGSHTDWSPKTGTDHFAMVNEHNPGMDDDTT